MPRRHNGAPHARGTVYSQNGVYSGRAQNLSQPSLNGDNVFANDGGALQVAAASGDNAGGDASALDVGVAIEGSDILLTDGFR